MLPKGKLVILHVARRQLGLGEEAWRDLLWRTAAVRSARELDAAGFEAVMHRLGELGFVSTSPMKPLPRRDGMAPPGQAQMIRALWARYTDGQGSDPSLGKWLEGRFKVSSIRFVTAELAPKAIAALRNMLAKKAAKQAAGGAPAADSSAAAS
jgi:hypothetical protein